MKSTKLPWAISAILLTLVIAMTYMFILSGSVEKSKDGRTAILLSSDEKDFVLTEMRGFLETVQEITVALSNDDLKAVAKLATASGKATLGGVPAPLMAKLPLEFKSLGIETHTEFDKLADVAKTAKTTNEVTARLGQLMLNCTGCHAGYKLKIESGPQK